MRIHFSHPRQSQELWWEVTEVRWGREEKRGKTKARNKTPRSPTRAEFVWEERQADGESEEVLRVPYAFG